MNEKELNKKIIKNTFWIYFFSYLAAPFGYFIRILYSNLPIEEYGLFYSMLSLFGILSIYNDLGFTETLSYFGVKFNEKKDYSKLKLTFYYCLFMQIISSIIIGIILFFINGKIINNYFKSIIAEKIIIYFFIYFIFLNITKPLIQIFAIKMNFFLNKIFNFLCFFLIFFLSFIFYSLNKLNIIIIIKIWIFTYIILTIFYIILIYKKIREFKNIKIKIDLKLYKQIFNYAIYVLLGSAIATIITKIDLQMITYFLDLKNVAYYDTSYSIAKILMIISIPIFVLIYPLTTKLIENKNLNKLNKILKITTKYFFIILTPITLILIFYSKFLISFFFKKELFFSNTLNIILIISTILNIFISFIFNILSGMGKIKIKNKIIFLGAILNFILNIILIPKIGILGAGISSLIIFIIMSFMSFIYIKKQKIDILLKKSFWIKLAITNIIFITTIFILNKYLLINTILKIIIIITISSIIYVLLSWQLKLFRIFEIIKILNIKKLKKIKILKKI